MRVSERETEKERGGFPKRQREKGGGKKPATRDTHGILQLRVDHDTQSSEQEENNV